MATYWRGFLFGLLVGLSLGISVTVLLWNASQRRQIQALKRDVTETGLKLNRLND